MDRMPLLRQYRRPLRAIRGGFTAIELIIVMTIMVITLGATIPFLGAFQQNNLQVSAGQDILLMLRRAQHRAITGDSSTNWGVWIGSGTTALFAGDSYAERDTSYDEIHTFARSMTVGGLSEIVFEQVRGTPSQAGTITFSSPTKTSTITINAVGGTDLATSTP